MELSKKLAIGMILTCAILNGCRVMPADSEKPPDDSPQATASQTLTNTTMPAPSLPATKMPALRPEPAEAALLELLHNNGGCFLPCLWGFAPVQDTGEFLSFLAEIGTDDGRILILRDDLILEIQMALAGDSNAIYTQTYRELGHGFEKDYDSGYYNKYFQNYSLHSLLATYGPPEEAYVVLDRGIADMGLGMDLYFLSVEYPKDGWMAVFEMPLLKEGDVYFGCPSRAFTNLRLWSPGNIPAGAFLGGFGGEDKSYLFTIEEATSLTLEQFYEKFRDPANTACLETPANIRR